MFLTKLFSKLILQPQDPENLLNIPTHQTEQRY